MLAILLIGLGFIAFFGSLLYYEGMGKDIQVTYWGLYTLSFALILAGFMELRLLSLLSRIDILIKEVSELRKQKGQGK